MPLGGAAAPARANGSLPFGRILNETPLEAMFEGATVGIADPAMLLFVVSLTASATGGGGSSGFAEAQHSSGCASDSTSLADSRARRFSAISRCIRVNKSCDSAEA